MAPVSSETMSHHRIGLLGKAERGPMPRAESSAGCPAAPRGAETTGGEDAAVLHDHGAVVERPVEGEDGDDEARGQFGVDFVPVSTMFLMPTRGETRRARPRFCSARISAAVITRFQVAEARLGVEAEPFACPRRMMIFLSSGWNTMAMAMKSRERGG
jgi:hypothetical protein